MGAKPVSLLVIGCGLIGASIAMAWRKVEANARIVGVETNPDHRAQARSLILPQNELNSSGDGAQRAETAAGQRVFDDVLDALPEDTFDVGVLAVPVQAACHLLADVADRAHWVFDVCSVKQPLITRATELNLQERFAPTHPMAGAAAGGPLAARGDLFVGASWLVIAGWPACQRVETMFRAMGAYVVEVASAQEHDRAMAAVSHGVHVASLAVMTAYAQAITESHAQSNVWGQLTGPGFRDVTRLAASPSSFWVSTLLANREAVTAHIERIRGALGDFAQALMQNDAEEVARLLETARLHHEQWQTVRRMRPEQGRE
ncbi:prephenate dehydrogenase [Alicyclobacillus herbarius]|uniref:prephenate dehydrogenase n=1 Tax=Alicyclobacillus herbarius TaxID=122960 RepID=UPI000429342D|nr:prephenate dehydrogenase/arogenate dehydrogenase family protein [Alicyclobacillus herbarius]